MNGIDLEKESEEFRSILNSLDDTLDFFEDENNAKEETEGLDVEENNDELAGFLSDIHQSKN